MSGDDDPKEPVLTSLTVNSYNDGFFRFQLGNLDSELSDRRIFFEIKHEELRKVWPGLKDLIEKELKVYEEMKGVMTVKEGRRWHWRKG